MTEDLQEIKLLLQDIKGILLLLNQEKIDATKSKLVKPDSVEYQVYELCDGSYTLQDIATKIQKSSDYTSAVISTLRRKGLVRTFEKDGKKISVQIV